MRHQHLSLRRAVIIAPYFTPSNLAGVVRPRLLAARLPECGWEPVVVATDPVYYEEPGDAAALALLPAQLRVEQVSAWPARLCRPLGFGDISLRSQFALRRKVAELVREGPVDLIFCTVLPGYTSLVGAWARRRLRLPFVLDYQDPWVSDAGAKQPRFSKAGLAHWLAMKLEPGAVRQADALTAVSGETLATLRTRRLIRPGMPIEVLPIGADARDHEAAARHGQSRIARAPETCEIAYVGTLTARMLPALRTVLLAAKELAGLGLGLRIHLIGTSAQPAGRDDLGVARVISDVGADSFVRLHPARIPYLDALRTLQEADLLLLLGSTDSHYTASKIFPCWLANRPILGVFHQASTVTELSAELGGIRLVTYDSTQGPETKVQATGKALKELIKESPTQLPPRHEAAFAPYSSLGIARRFATLFDRIVESSRSTKG